MTKDWFVFATTPAGRLWVLAGEGLRPFIDFKNIKELKGRTKQEAVWAVGIGDQGDIRERHPWRYEVKDRTAVERLFIERELFA